MRPIIQFSHEILVFRPGDVAIGEIIVPFEIPPIYQVNMEWRGEVRIWDGKNVIIHDSIFRTTKTLDKPARNEVDKYPFKFHLPLDIPSSIHKILDGKETKISYKVQVDIKDASQAQISTNTAGFLVIEGKTVEGVLANEPRVMDITKKSCFCPSKISFVLAANKSVLYPGETLVFSIACVSCSSKEMVKGAKLKMIQNTTVHCKEKFVSQEIILSECLLPNFLAHSDLRNSQITKELKLPAVPPTTDNHHLIISYFLRFSIESSSSYNHAIEDIPFDVVMYPNQINSQMTSESLLPRGGSVISKKGKIRVRKDDTRYKRHRHDQHNAGSGGPVVPVYTYFTKIGSSFEIHYLEHGGHVK